MELGWGSNNDPERRLCHGRYLELRDERDLALPGDPSCCCGASVWERSLGNNIYDIKVPAPLFPKALQAAA